MARAHAFLGNSQVSHTFRFNPDAANWSYQNNISSQDTLGGRVVQLLSVSVQGVTITGRAGSRGELQRLADNVKEIMNYHVRTQRPVQFKVPSRNWNFLVYVQAMPQVGWDVAATSYPYSLTLAVEEDLAGVFTKKLESAALERIAGGIGYNPDIHGGNTAAFTEFVDTVLKLAPDTVTSNGGGGSDGQYSGDMGSVKGLTSGPTTQAVVTIIKAVQGEFPNVSGAGTYSCRGTASGGFSQHSAGNAWDINGPSTAFLDDVYRFLVANLNKGMKLPISQIIWHNKCSAGPNCSGGYVSGHEDHIHVSGKPYLSKPIQGCNP